MLLFILKCAATLAGQARCASIWDESAYLLPRPRQPEIQLLPLDPSLPPQKLLPLLWKLLCPTSPVHSTTGLLPTAISSHGLACQNSRCHP